MFSLHTNVFYGPAALKARSLHFFECARDVDIGKVNKKASCIDKSRRIQ